MEAIQKLNQTIPCDSWFYSFCQNNSIVLKNKESLEQSRQECCNQFNVGNFFTKFQNLLFQKDWRLIFNCDETSSISSRKYKSLLLSKKNLATAVVAPSEPQISVMICYSASSYKLDPFVILPGLKNLPNELTDFQAFFASQKNKSSLSSTKWEKERLFQNMLSRTDVRPKHYRNV